MIAALLSACSARPVDTAPPTIAPATAAVSPPATTAPAGSVRALAGAPQAAVFDAKTSTLAVLTAGGLTLMGPGRQPPRVIALPAPVNALAGSGDGRLYLASRGGYFETDVAAGRVTRRDVDGQAGTDFTAIARRADGTLVLGSADGAVFLLSSPTAVGQRMQIFARVDSLVTQGNTTVVLDRGQTSVTTIDADGRAQQALRAGEGATTMAADPAGRVLVTDTRGDELLVFSVDPLIMRQRYPVPSAPYGVSGSQQLAWVSQTASNVVVGYDLATGIPVEKVRYPTVQQPNILTVDPATDTLYVVSGSGAGVQVIEHAAVPR